MVLERVLLLRSCSPKAVTGYMEITLMAGDDFPAPAILMALVIEMDAGEDDEINVLSIPIWGTLLATGV